MRELMQQGDSASGGRGTAGLASVLLAVGLASGCAQDPILTYESPAPAQVLSTVEAAGVEDGRVRFRQLFCQSFDAIGALTADVFANLTDMANEWKPLEGGDHTRANLFIYKLEAGFKKEETPEEKAAKERRRRR